MKKKSVQIDAFLNPVLLMVEPTEVKLFPAHHGVLSSKFDGILKCLAFKGIPFFYPSFKLKLKTVSPKKTLENWQFGNYVRERWIGDNLVSLISLRISQFHRRHRCRH